MFKQINMRNVVRKIVDSFGNIIKDENRKVSDESVYLYKEKID